RREPPASLRAPKRAPASQGTDRPSRLRFGIAMVCMLKFLLLSAALVSNQMSSSCVEILRGYMANTNRANWQLVAQFVAADAIVQLQRRRRRKPIRRLLRDRRQLGEYFTLVRDMRNGDGTDFFQYFRMSVERFDRLVELLRPLIEPRRSTVVSLSAGEKLAFTLRWANVTFLQPSVQCHEVSFREQYILHNENLRHAGPFL
ncbi:hypothetical protein V5799_004251, partial [Amblyomma americanum]